MIFTKINVSQWDNLNSQLGFFRCDERGHSFFLPAVSEQWEEWAGSGLRPSNLIKTYFQLLNLLGDKIFPTVRSVRRGWAGAKPQDGSESIVVHCPRKWSHAVLCRLLPSCWYKAFRYYLKYYVLRICAALCRLLSCHRLAVPT